MNIKIPKIAIGIPLILLAAIIIEIAIDSTETETFTSNNSMNTEFEENPRNNESEFSNNLYSGPFAILDGTYGVDDTVFLIGSGIPLDSKGEIVFLRPDGKIHHKYPFDGSKSAVNHYFTPASSSDLQECPDCKFFGTWTISFRIDEGISYAPMSFEVIDSEN